MLLCKQAVRFGALEVVRIQTPSQTGVASIEFNLTGSDASASPLPGMSHFILHKHPQQPVLIRYLEGEGNQTRLKTQPVSGLVREAMVQLLNRMKQPPAITKLGVIINRAKALNSQIQPSVPAFFRDNLVKMVVRFPQVTFPQPEDPVRYLFMESTLEFFRQLLTGQSEGKPGVVLSNRTYCFRDPELYRMLPRLLNSLYDANRYPDGIDITSVGCSTGYEPLSIALALDHVMPEQAGRFRIHGRDIEPGAVDLAQKYCILGDAMAEVYQFLGADTRHYLRPYTGPADFAKDLYTASKGPLRTLQQEDTALALYEAVPEIQKRIDYGVSTIQEIARQKQDKPSVLLFRYAWYHLSDAEQKDVAQKLYQNMKPGSLVIIGQAERDYGTYAWLLEAGFKQLGERGPQQLVFVRPDEAKTP